jgi:outer membrane protein assembly factor BamB
MFADGGLRCALRCLSLVALSVCACDDDHIGGSGRATYLWQDQYDSEIAGESASDNASDVAACDGRVFVVGRTGTTSEAPGYFHVRVYNADDGELLWEDRAENGYGGSMPYRVACEGDRVIVAGIVSGHATLRAYAARDGASLWELVFDGGDETDVSSLRMEDHVVYVARRATTFVDGAPETSSARLALRAESGVELWRDETSLPAPWAWSRLAVGSDRVCSLDEDQRGDGLTYSLRCLRRKDGALVWNRGLGSPYRIEAAAIAFVPESDFVLAASGEGDTTILRAFRAHDGRKVWEHAYPPLSLVIAVAATPDRVLIAGVQFILDDDFLERDMLFVEGRDPETGDLLWSDWVEDDQPREIALDGSRLIVADVSWRAFVYDVLAGTRIIEEPALAEPKGRWMWGTAANRGRYFLAGVFFGTTDWDNLDWGVRGYSLR